MGFIYHMMQDSIIDDSKKVCMLPKDKFYINLENVGNTISSTVFIGLKECIKNGTIHSGMNVMACGFGVGLSWGGTLLQFV